MTKFWEIEVLQYVRPISKDKNKGENIFVETTRRNQDRRFIVTLVTEAFRCCLGGTYHQSKKMFYKTEQLLENAVLREQYVNFM